MSGKRQERRPQHRPEGDPCARCGLEAAKHHYRTKEASAARRVAEKAAGAAAVLEVVTYLRATADVMQHAAESKAYQGTILGTADSVRAKQLAGAEALRWAAADLERPGWQDWLRQHIRDRGAVVAASSGGGRSDVAAGAVPASGAAGKRVGVAERKRVA